MEAKVRAVWLEGQGVVFWKDLQQPSHVVHTTLQQNLFSEAFAVW